MSLEIAISENTAAIRVLIALLQNNPPAATMTAAAYVETLDAKAEAKKPALTQVAAATPVATTEAVAASPSEQVEQVVIDYAKDVKPLLLKVSTTKGRDALVGLLTKFGVAKGDALPANKLGDVIAEVELLLAA